MCWSCSSIATLQLGVASNGGVMVSIAALQAWLELFIHRDTFASGVQQWGRGSLDRGPPGTWSSAFFPLCFMCDHFIAANFHYSSRVLSLAALAIP